MKRTTHLVLFIAALILALMAGALGPYAVYADDGVTTEPAGDEAAAAELTEDGGVEEEVVSVPEVLEQAPEGTGIVVVNEEGEILPLVTEEAQEVISSSDPMWCPEGSTPGDTSCTAGFATFAELIDALKADALLTTPRFTGNGVIWVEDTYAGNDDAQVEFDGSVLTNIGLSNLTIQGAWSGNADTNFDAAGTSDLDVSLVIANWGGNVSLKNLAIIAEDASGFGLLVDTSGGVSMNKVYVTDTEINAYGYGDGALVEALGTVDISNSQFDNNEGNGLQILSGGNVTLDTVSASGNDLTGAYVDTCVYDAVTGLCAENGLVTITSLTTGNDFNNNGVEGLVIDSGGGAALDHVQANDNGLDGAVITSADNDGTGDVDIDASEFSGNTNAYGLDVYTDGNIDLSNVTANSNGLGTFLDTTHGTGSVDVSDSVFGDSNLTGNTWTGLHIESGANVNLLNLIASYNGTNGTYVEAEGNIYVENGQFNENVHFNFPQDPGLYAESNGGNITLLDVVADGNDFGAGVVLTTNAAGTVDVSSSAPGNSHFNGNGLFGIQTSVVDGDITLEEIEASYNHNKGAYLKAYGIGNIFITGSEFTENGEHGIHASTYEGDITLTNLDVIGDDQVAATLDDNLTDIGAFLKSYNAGNIFVVNSTFNLNRFAGLVAATDSTIELTNVTANENGVNGAELYTRQTVSCRSAADGVTAVTIDVTGGEFSNNGEYGIFAKPGPAGVLNFNLPATVFGGNGIDDYLVDLSSPDVCPPPVEEPEETENPKVVISPSLPVKQDCALFTSTIHKLPNGSFVNVGCPYEGFSSMEDLPFEQLPAPLGAGTTFINGMIVRLTDADGNIIFNPDGTVTINFALPENGRGRTHSILFWDPTLNNGQGGWMKLPAFEAGTSFPLHPENPDDERLVISGVQQSGNFISITVNFSGTFVLVSP
ncbi:MAG: right-handed parallel beta-helix repeat-containing protein [Anaerolineales bacterium]|nr:right-handed parallel beta-helix repeat-containing protein [Anaerolineales bacterium]